MASPLIALLALTYGLYGRHLPGEFGHPGLPVESFLGTMVIAEGGLWGSLTGVSVNIVAVFVIMGAVLNQGEAGQGFMNLASAAAGRLKGGAARKYRSYHRLCLVQSQDRPRRMSLQPVPLRFRPCENSDIPVPSLGRSRLWPHREVKSCHP